MFGFSTICIGVERHKCQKQDEITKTTRTLVTLFFVLEGVQEQTPGSQPTPKMIAEMSLFGVAQEHHESLQLLPEPLEGQLAHGLILLVPWPFFRAETPLFFHSFWQTLRPLHHKFPIRAQMFPAVFSNVNINWSRTRLFQKFFRRNHC